MPNTPDKRYIFNADDYYGQQAEQWAIERISQTDDLTEAEVREQYTDDQIFNQQMEIMDSDYEWVIENLNAFFAGERGLASDYVNKSTADNHLIARGSMTRWNGEHRGLDVAKGFDDLRYCLFQDCEITQIWDENGHLFIRGTHHDGSVTVEVRQLSDEGEAAWHEIDTVERWGTDADTFEVGDQTYDVFDTDGAVRGLFTDERLAPPVRYAELAYGLPAEEWEPEPEAA